MDGMADGPASGVVSTIEAKCRRCYHCVRHCPSKAIRVRGGQAQVIEERCIGCGRCIKVCAQKAKRVRAAGKLTRRLLAGPGPTVAILAPSYPAAFPNASPSQVVAATRRLGFSRVMEVSYGGEMIGHAYPQFLSQMGQAPAISSACPALVAYIRRYMPDLVPNIVPVATPMIAMGRAIKQVLMPGAQVVFIGPCIAKKLEHLEPYAGEAVDAAMTFSELSEMLLEDGVDLGAVTLASEQEGRPDPPLPCAAAHFPLSGGLLRAASIQADFVSERFLVIDGDRRCIEALQALRDQPTPSVFLDVLLCEGGCIGGPGFPGDSTPLAGRIAILERARELDRLAPPVQDSLWQLREVDLSCHFTPDPITLPIPTEKEIRDTLSRSGRFSPADELNCGACGYTSCREKAIAACQGLAEAEMCLPYLIDQLEANVRRLTHSREEVEKARELATKAQHLAAMGELAADVAHGISKPLANIAVFAQLLRDSFSADDQRRAEAELVVAEAVHCRDVLSSLEGFARRSPPRLDTTRVSDVVHDALLAIEPELRSRPIDLAVALAPDLPDLVADGQQLSQVLVRVLTNSIEAIDGEGRIELQARLCDGGRGIELHIQDDGRGIPATLLPNVFQPFVTTKREGNAAGLGLAAAHGIVKNHSGDILIESTEGSGATVTIRLPLAPVGAPRRESIRLLLVDDDPDILQQHRLQLEAMGYEVFVAERFDEAMEMADDLIPDAFVLDLMMEKVDSGARLARALRRDPRFGASPIIILSSVVDEAGFEFSRNPQEVLNWIKADAWFDKPAPIKQLSATLRRLIEERRTDEGSEAEPSAG